MTINATKSFNLQTYNFNCGAVTVAGTLGINTSAGTGLTCAGITWNTGSTSTLAVAGKINCSGNKVFPNADVTSNTGGGIFTQTANANWSSESALNAMGQLIINSGVTVTTSGPLNGNIASGLGTNAFTLNGVIAFADPNHSWRLDLYADTTFTIGANGNFTGNNYYFLLQPTGLATINNSRTTAFSVTGTIYSLNYVGANNVYILGNLNFAQVYRIDCTLTKSKSIIGGTGTLKSQQLIVRLTAGDTINWTNSANNFSYQGGSWYPNDTGLAWTFNYTKGTGTITLDERGGNSTSNFWGKSVEDIVINALGTTKTFGDGSFTTDSLTMTAGTCALKNGVTVTMTDFSGTGGTLTSDSAGNQADIALTNVATVSGITFKDIDTNPTQAVNWKINGKNNCTNNGNNTGILFTDFIGGI